MSFRDADAREERILFHTTERSEADVILREGFMAAYASLGEAVYFYGTLASAQTFARQRSYRTFEDPVVLAIRDPRPRKVDRSDLDSLQDMRVYEDVWTVYLDDAAGEDRFVPAMTWVADPRPRARTPLRSPLSEPIESSPSVRVP